MKAPLLPFCFLALAACVTDGPPRLAAASHPDGPESAPLAASTAFAHEEAAADSAEARPVGDQAGGSDTPPAAGAARQAGTTVYTCPMHPEIERAEPGRCPACGMALVRKKVSGGEPAPGSPASGKHEEHRDRPQGVRP